MRSASPAITSRLHQHHHYPAASHALDACAVHSAGQHTKKKKNTRCATTVNNKKATTATQGTNKQWSRVFKCTTGCATSPRRQRWSPRQGALSVQRGKDGGHDWRAYCSSEELCYHLKQPPFSNIYWSLLAHNNATA